MSPLPHTRRGKKRQSPTGARQRKIDAKHESFEAEQKEVPKGRRERAFGSSIAKTEEKLGMTLESSSNEGS